MGSVLIRRRPSSTTTLPFSRRATIRSSCSRRRSTCALGRRPDPRRKITTEDVTAYLSANLLGRPARRPPRRSRPAYRDPSRVGLRGRPSIAPQRRPARAHCLQGSSKGERDLRREGDSSRAPLPQRNAAPPGCPGAWGGVGRKDLLVVHAIGHHPHDRGYQDTWAPNAGRTVHLVWVNRNTVESHLA
jgi:hypothetical protein